jgi:signal transduction histidine kinase
MPGADFARFTSALVHELRTPVSVIAGEVDLALARERSPAAYREALARIAERAAELVDLTSDFAFLGAAAPIPARAGETAGLQEIFGGLARRFGSRRGHVLTVPLTHPESVMGNALLIVTALSLLVEHAIKHRRGGARVRLDVAPAGEPATTGAAIELVLDAPPAGFTAATWQPLAAGAAGTTPPGSDLRLEGAARLVHEFGGSLEPSPPGGADHLVIRLRRAVRRGAMRERR